MKVNSINNAPPLKENRDASLMPKGSMPEDREDIPSKRKDIGMAKNSPVQKENQKNDQKVLEKKINEAIDTVDKAVSIFNHKLHFVKHKESDRIMVQVIDTDTDKVIREIPPEEILDIVARLKQFVGLLVDERA